MDQTAESHDQHYKRQRTNEPMEDAAGDPDQQAPSGETAAEEILITEDASRDANVARDDSAGIKSSAELLYCPRHPLVRISSGQTSSSEDHGDEAYKPAPNGCPYCTPNNNNDVWVLLEPFEKLNMDNQEQSLDKTIQNIQQATRTLSAREDEAGDDDDWCLVDNDKLVGNNDSNASTLTSCEALKLLADELGQINLKLQRIKSIAPSEEDDEDRELVSRLATELPKFQDVATTVVETLRGALLSWKTKHLASNNTETRHVVDTEEINNKEASSSNNQDDLLVFSCRVLTSLAFPRKSAIFAEQEDAETCAHRLLELGGLDIAMEVLQLVKNPDFCIPSRIIEKALAVVVNLSATYPGCQAVLNANGIPLLIDLLSPSSKQHSSVHYLNDNAFIYEHGLSVLSQLMVLYNEKRSTAGNNENQASPQDPTANNDTEQHQMRSIVIDIMKRFPREPRVQARACSLLIPLFRSLPGIDSNSENTMDDDKTGESSSSPSDMISEVLLLVLKALEEHGQQEPMTLHCALVALQNLSSFDMPTKQGTILAGGVDTVLQIAQDSLEQARKEAQSLEPRPNRKRPLHEEPLTQLEHACCTLANMSIDIMYGLPASVEAGCTEAFVEILDLSLASSSSDNLYNKKENKSWDYAMIQDATMSTLSRIASQAACKPRIVAAASFKSIPIFVQIMDQKRNNAEIAKHGVALLGNLASGPNSQTVAMLPHKGLEAILQAMICHFENTELQVFATGGVFNFLDNEGARQLLLSVSLPSESKDLLGYQIVLDSMKRHINSVDVQVRSSGCLLRFAKLGGAVDIEVLRQMVDCLQTALEHHDQNIPVKVGIYKAFAQICTNKIGQEVVVAAGCDKVVSTALASISSQNINEVLQAATFLANACGNYFIQTVILSQEGIQALVRSIESHSASEHKYAVIHLIAVTLRNLCNNAACQAVIIHKAVPTIQSCLESHAQDPTAGDKPGKQPQEAAIINCLKLLSKISIHTLTSSWKPPEELIRIVIRVMDAHSRKNDRVLGAGEQVLANFSAVRDNLSKMATAGAMERILRGPHMDPHSVCCVLHNAARNKECLVEMEDQYVMRKLSVLLQMKRGNPNLALDLLQALANILQHAKKVDEGCSSSDDNNHQGGEISNNKTALFDPMRVEFCNNNGRDVISMLCRQHPTSQGIQTQSAVLLSLLE